MRQYIVINALGNYSPSLTEKLFKAIRDGGGNVADSRMARLGNEFSAMLLVTGSWDAIAKIEDSIPRLSRDLELNISARRTEKRPASGGGMPYAVDVVCSDRIGVVHDITRFLMDHQVDIMDLYCNSFQSPQTGTQMFSLHMSVNVPTDTSIAALRGEFMEFCDRLNLDAIMEPVK